MSNIRAHAEQGFLSGERESPSLTFREQVFSALEDAHDAARMAAGIVEAIAKELGLVRGAAPTGSEVTSYSPDDSIQQQ